MTDQGSAASRCKAVADVFIACAAMIPRNGRSYDDWLHEVTHRFKQAWRVIST